MRAVCVVAISLIGASLAGCVSMTTATGRSLRVGTDEYAAYVEQVFREQNRVASRLAFALVDLSDTDGPGYRALAAAEDGLINACEALNEIAARRRDGERIGPLKGLDAARSAPRCERAAKAAEAALGQSGLASNTAGGA